MYIYSGDDAVATPSAAASHGRQGSVVYLYLHIGEGLYGLADAVVELVGLVLSGHGVEDVGDDGFGTAVHVIVEYVVALHSRGQQLLFLGVFQSAPVVYHELGGFEVGEQLLHLGDDLHFVPGGLGHEFADCLEYEVE